MPDTSSESMVEYTCEDHIATIALNRPEKLNAINDELVRQLAEALRRFDIDSDAWVGILCGRGRAFSSGADVQQRQLRSRDEFEQLGGPQGWGTTTHELMFQAVNWKPVIAATHGYVLGAALSLVLDCDLIVAEKGTKFQLTETARGLGGSKQWAQFHFRNAGAFGDEVALTGRFFTAEEALAAGVINRVAAPGKFMETARDLATAMNQNPPLSVRSIVRTRRWYLSERTREAHFLAAPMKLYLTEDFGEAARAFAEKRTAKPFRGR